jgi:D-alanine-D-alanine ligase
LVKDYDFYSFDEKYINNKMSIDIPAKINNKLSEEIKILSKRVYKLCDCRGFARVDFFVANEKIYFNEINTIP